MMSPIRRWPDYAGLSSIVALGNLGDLVSVATARLWLGLVLATADIPTSKA